MTMEDRGNRSTSKFLKLDISNIKYYFFLSILSFLSVKLYKKLNINVRLASNGTCENFERRRDSDINEMIFCCEIQ